MTSEVHDESLRYVHALGGAPLLGTIGVFGLLAALACCAVRMRFALGRREVVGRSNGAACARP
jgi:hypothetical protein